MDKNKSQVKPLPEIANPLTEVKSSAVMAKYLGYEVPVIDDKEVDKYIVIGKNNYAEHARIIYKDGSEFNMEQGDLDVSGIYGGKIIKKESISGINITINSYENITYATWKYNDYSYSYAMKDVDENIINLEINKIMTVIG